MDQAEETERQERNFEDLLIAFRTATNISVGSNVEGLYNLLDAVENLIHPEYEGDASDVRDAVNSYEFFRIRKEQRTAMAAEVDTQGTAGVGPSEITLDGVVYLLHPKDDA